MHEDLHALILRRVGEEASITYLGQCQAHGQCSSYCSDDDSGKERHEWFSDSEQGPA